MLSIPSRLGALSVLLLALGAVPAAQAQIVVTSPGTVYRQDFDSLAASGTGHAWEDNATLPGWYSTRVTYNAGTGSSNAGALYSFGTGADRALGSVASGSTGTLYYGVRLANASGRTLTALDIAYTGEQWRNGGNTAQHWLAFQYRIAPAGEITAINTPATGWTAVSALDFTGPVATATAAALDGNAAANRAAVAGRLDVRVPDGHEIWLRWVDIDNAGADHGLAIDDLRIAFEDAGALPALSIADAMVEIGEDGVPSPLVFAVELDAAAAQDVRFAIATSDGTAQAGVHYVARSEAEAVIPAGERRYDFIVDVLGNPEPSTTRTLTVTVSGLDGAEGLDLVATGRIVNTAVVLTPIGAIQGPGTVSPKLGDDVVTEGIVTATRRNGFVIQSAPGEEDDDPLSAEGIFVFTGNDNVPAVAQVGHRVRAAGRVSQFLRTPHGLPLTQLGSPLSVTLRATGQPLPAPVVLDEAALSPDTAPDHLARYETMRVSVPALEVVGPSNAQGVFFGVLPGTPRPFREEGMGVLDVTPLPPGVTPPWFDTNPERLRVESATQTGATPIHVDVGTVITGLTGVLYYDSGDYTLLPDPGLELGFAGGAVPHPVAPRPEGAISIGGFNIENLDLAEDSPANSLRLRKLALAICQYLRTPDVLGLVEIRDLATAQRLAQSLNDDEFGHCPESPAYEAYLIPAATGTQNLGFLVRTAPVASGLPRVEALTVVQEGAAERLVAPDGSATAVLNDRPPLRLMAAFNADNGARFELTVIANHLLSLIDINSLASRNDSWVTEGNRRRNKRLQQALWLAGLIEQRQSADPQEKILLLGDFNAFEFNDGYVDVMGIVTGQPAPPDRVLLHADSPLRRPLLNLTTTTPAEQRYSFVFAGNAQTLDHVLVNQPLQDEVEIWLEHPRINADFGADHAGDGTLPTRTSDHDPVVAYLLPPAFLSADLKMTLSGPTTPVRVGQIAEFVARVSHAGPQPALRPTVEFVLDSAANDPVVDAPAGWDCEAPVTAGTDLRIVCRNGTRLEAGEAAVFTLRSGVRRDAPRAFLGVHAEAASASTDPAPQNNRAGTGVRIVGLPGFPSR